MSTISEGCERKNNENRWHVGFKNGLILKKRKISVEDLPTISFVVNLKSPQLWKDCSSEAHLGFLPVLYIQYNRVYNTSFDIFTRASFCCMTCVKFKVNGKDGINSWFHLFSLPLTALAKPWFSSAHSEPNSSRNMNTWDSKMRFHN